MRVNELAKDLGKTSKEGLDILQKNQTDVKSSQANVSDDQAAAVKKAAEPKKEAAAGTEKPAEGAQAQPAKKRIAAVYRPQNSSQKNRPSGGQKQGQRPQRPAGAGGMQVRPTTSPAQKQERPAAPAGTAAQAKPQTAAQQAGTAPQVQAAEVTGQQAKPQTAATAPRAEQEQSRQAGSAQGGRDSRQGGNFQGNRDGRQGGSYQGSRDGRPAGSAQGGRDGRQGGSYQGSRDGRQGGNFQGNRDGRQGGNFQGSRDGRPGGNYQGSRDGRQGGNFQGSRDGRPGGNYQGSRDGRQGGSFQGNRDGRQGGRPGGNFQGGRDGGRGLNIPKPSFDAPISQKQQNTKASKNAYKKEHDSKKDHEEEMTRGKGGKGGKNVKAPVMPPQPKKVEKVEEIKTIVIPEVITIKELADKMKLQPSAIVKKLFLQGTIVTINQEIDFEKAEEIAMEYDVLCEKEKKINVIEELLKEEEEDEKDMVPRPPVICVMGHVDHGKTSLLDAIRETNVTAKEAGGITQHIGAYVVEANGQKITFLDTPGHEAFTAMRMRGAQATDIAILVVAADDGVMPQTVEAINHAKAAGVEIIVAVNKIDKPSANVERVKQELSEYELIPEDWGGSTVFVPVSAHTKEGIPELLEMILLTAEVKELKANPNRKARGLVIEAQLDKGKGPVATVLVQKGTLHVGDSIAAGSCFGKVRAMMDDKGRRVKEAGPSTPVEILGLNDVPNAGEVFVSTVNEKEARNFAETFITEGKNKLIEDTKAKLSLDDLFSQIKAGNVKELPIIVKADVQGSVEAVKQSLVKLSNEEVVVKVIHGGVGTITESDVTLASASNAIIIGFNVRPDATAKSIADREKVDVRLYRVIYQAIEDVEAAMKGMLDPIFEEQVTGHAVVRQTFKASGVGTIAGSYVLDGKITRGCKARITRDGEQIFEGPLASLKRFKDDVKEVNAGYECGLVFEGFNDLKEDDMIEVYIMVEVPR